MVPVPYLRHREPHLTSTQGTVDFLARDADRAVALGQKHQDPLLAAFTQNLERWTTRLT